MVRFNAPLLGLSLFLSVLVTGLPMDGLNDPSPDGAMSPDQASTIAFEALKVKSTTPSHDQHHR